MKFCSLAIGAREKIITEHSGANKKGTGKVPLYWSMRERTTECVVAQTKKGLEKVIAKQWRD